MRLASLSRRPAAAEKATAPGEADGPGARGAPRGARTTPETGRPDAEAPEPAAAERTPPPDAQAARAADPAGRGADRPAPAREGGGGERAAAAGGGAPSAETGPAREAMRRSYAAAVLAAIARERRYPDAARRTGQEGVAEIVVTLGRDGRLASARLARSSGHARLDSAALGAARAVGRYPEAPEALPGERFRFAVPLRFELR
jgi:protein TonB